ncbi:MAG TPA: hypothetical protein VJ914_37680 [Pseudonocardiaceae bacterium]|nr:hypothetical protein [Pseudonocardiaceae bacterium]
MPTLSPSSAPRVRARPTRIRPADTRPPAPGDQCQIKRSRKHLRHPKGTLAVAIIIIGLTTAACGQPSGPSVDASAPVSQQECVSAVYTVLSGMIAKPDDDQPFDDFVTRYSPTSPTYTAYRDSFDPFYSEAVAHGVKAAEDAVRSTVTRDCSTTN